MIEDILFSKLYKNKNYLTKLFEARNKTNYADIINAMKNSDSFLKYKNFTDESITLVSYCILTELIPLNSNDIKKDMLSKCKKYFSKGIFKNIPLSYEEIPSNVETPISYVCTPVKYLTLNYKTGNFIAKNVILYGLTSTDSTINNFNIFKKNDPEEESIGFSFTELDKKYNEKIKNALLKFTELYNNKQLEDIDRNNINDSNINNNDKQPTEQKKKYTYKPAPNLWKYDVDTTDDTTEKSKSDLTMHIKSYKDSKGVLPFLYTNEVVTDDRARKYNDVCNMVENNVVALEEKLLTNLASTVKYNKNNINMQNDMRKDIHKEYEDNYEEIDGIKYVKSFDNYLNGISSHQDLKNLSKISVNVCDVYLRAMADAKKFVFNEDYINSKGLNYNLHLYLTEVLSPLAVVANKCHWNKLHENEGFEVFRDYVKLPENNDFVNEAYINYPTESNFPLADSAIYINGYRLYVSTKAGLNGLGAQASIKSLHQFMYNPENPNELTGLAQEMKNTYPEQFALFEMFLTKGVNYLNWKEISNITNGQVTSKFELQKYVNLNKDVYTTIIMKVLQAAAFQFVQVNCKASSTTDNFHFDYRVQYPAVFKGNVDIEIPDKGYIKFHIVEAQ